MARANRLLLLTSGGDAPGMNSAIRSVVRTALANDLEVLACHDGYQGLINRALFAMRSSDVSGCIQLGGTILRSGRSEAFKEPKNQKKVADFLRSRELDYLVAIGGDGTFRGAKIIEELSGVKTIGIPATIDNDVVGTEYTIGFDTARNNAVSALDKIRDTSASSGLNFLVEVMGRRAGFLALDVGISAGAEYILVPEFPENLNKIASEITNPLRPKRSIIIVVSEAQKAGRSFEIADKLRKLTPGREYRVCVLGHVQRGGMPTTLDRLMASIMGNMAVTSLIQGYSKVMVAYNGGTYELAPFPEVKTPARTLAKKDLLELNKILAR